MHTAREEEEEDVGGGGGGGGGGGAGGGKCETSIEPQTTANSGGQSQTTAVQSPGAEIRMRQPGWPLHLWVKDHHQCLKILESSRLVRDARQEAAPKTLFHDAVLKPTSCH